MCPKTARKAAELYRQTDDLHYFLFDYYRDGADTPKNPRAAVLYWMRDMCHACGCQDWPWILEIHSSAEDCPNRLQWINRPCMQRERDKVYSLLEPAELRHESMCQSDCQIQLMSDFLSRERVRLLYDGAQNGDARCETILQKLLDNGTVPRELLTQLSPNRYGVCDWTDAWYEEALERIESKLAREAKQAES